MDQFYRYMYLMFYLMFYCYLNIWQFIHNTNEKKVIHCTYMYTVIINYDIHLLFTVSLQWRQSQIVSIISAPLQMLNPVTSDVVRTPSQEFVVT